MKKLLSLLLALSLFGAACGESTPDDKEEESQAESENEDKDNKEEKEDDEDGDNDKDAEDDDAATKDDKDEENEKDEEEDIASSSDLDETLSQLFAEGILEEDDPDFPVTEDQAKCVGDNVVEKVGAERLIELGFDAEGSNPEDLNLSQKEAEAISESMLDCVDFKDILVSSITADGGISEDDATCVIDGIDDDTIEGLMAEQFGESDGSSEAEFENQMFEQIAECGVEFG